MTRSSKPPDGLGSQPPPPPREDDHIRGEGPLIIEYSDLTCPACAVAHAQAGLQVRRVFRHFPLASRRPRSRPLAHAAEAAALQGRFWEFVDSVFADQGHLDDPHLWERCEQLGLDLGRFEADRRSEPVAARVERDFRDGIRAGVAGTPTTFRM